MSPELRRRLPFSASILSWLQFWPGSGFGCDPATKCALHPATAIAGLSLDLAAGRGFRNRPRDHVDPRGSDCYCASRRRVGRLDALEFAGEISRRTRRRLALRAVASALRHSSRLSSAAFGFRRTSVELVAAVPSRRRCGPACSGGNGAGVLRGAARASDECGRAAARSRFGVVGGSRRFSPPLRCWFGLPRNMPISRSRFFTWPQSPSSCWSLLQRPGGACASYPGRVFARVWRPGPRMKASSS